MRRHYAWTKIICDNCGCEFPRKRSLVKEHGHKFCTRTCKYAYFHSLGDSRIFHKKKVTVEAKMHFEEFCNRLNLTYTEKLILNLIDRAQNDPTSAFVLALCKTIAKEKSGR